MDKIKGSGGAGQFLYVNDVNDEWKKNDELLTSITPNSSKLRPTFIHKNRSIYYPGVT